MTTVPASNQQWWHELCVVRPHVLHHLESDQPSPHWFILLIRSCHILNLNLLLIVQRSLDGLSGNPLFWPFSARGTPCICVLYQQFALDVCYHITWLHYMRKETIMISDTLTQKKRLVWSGRRELVWSVHIQGEQKTETAVGPLGMKHLDSSTSFLLHFCSFSVSFCPTAHS